MMIWWCSFDKTKMRARMGGRSTCWAGGAGQGRGGPGRGIKPGRVGDAPARSSPTTLRWASSTIFSLLLHNSTIRRCFTWEALILSSRFNWSISPTCGHRVRKVLGSRHHARTYQEGRRPRPGPQVSRDSWCLAQDSDYYYLDPRSIVWWMK